MEAAGIEPASRQIHASVILTDPIRIAQQNKLQRIVIQSKDGARLEVPAKLTASRIAALLEKIRLMDEPHIQL